MPCTLAMAGAVQCVVSPEGKSDNVAFASTSAPRGAMRDGRVLLFLDCPSWLFFQDDSFPRPAENFRQTPLFRLGIPVKAACSRPVDSAIESGSRS
jgi:hypothetical protein